MKLPTADYYDRISSEYDRVRFASAYAVKVDRLEREFVLGVVEKGSMVLEVGPGTGRFTQHLVKRVLKVVAVDQSRRMLDELCKKIDAPNLYVHHLSLSQLSELPDYGSFDWVVCMRVLPHVENLESALTSLKQALKPGGKAVLDLWNGNSFVRWRSRIGRRVCGGKKEEVLTRYHTYAQMVRHLQQAEFKVIDSVGWGYPRIGRFSLDTLGWKAAPGLAYSVVFCLSV